jgi:hypothetical protein
MIEARMRIGNTRIILLQIHLPDCATRAYTLQLEFALFACLPRSFLFVKCTHTIVDLPRLRPS